MPCHTFSMEMVSPIWGSCHAFWTITNAFLHLKHANDFNPFMHVQVSILVKSHSTLWTRKWLFQVSFFYPKTLVFGYFPAQTAILLSTQLLAIEMDTKLFYCLKLSSYFKITSIQRKLWLSCITLESIDIFCPNFISW